MNGSSNLKLGKFRKRNAPNVPGRLNWACRGIESIVQQTSTDKEELAVTAAAMEALVLCHERFLNTLTSELIATAPANSFYVKGDDVEKALNELGLPHLLEPAMEAAADSKPPAKKKRKGSFTAEDKNLQEKLLADSRERVLEGANSK